MQAAQRIHCNPCCTITAWCSSHGLSPRILWSLWCRLQKSHHSQAPGRQHLCGREAESQVILKRSKIPGFLLSRFALAYWNEMLSSRCWRNKLFRTRWLIWKEVHQSFFSQPVLGKLKVSKPVFNVIKHFWREKSERRYFSQNFCGIKIKIQVYRNFLLLNQ